MQIIHLSGNLTKDAKLEVIFGHGRITEYLVFQLAVKEISGTTENTTYYNVTCRKTSAIDWLEQGTKVNIFGKFHYRVTKGNDGKDYVNLDVMAYSVEQVVSEVIEKTSSTPDESIWQRDYTLDFNFKKL